MKDIHTSERSMSFLEKGPLVFFETIYTSTGCSFGTTPQAAEEDMSLVTTPLMVHRGQQTD